MAVLQSGTALKLSKLHILCVFGALHTQLNGTAAVVSRNEQM